MTMKGMRNMKHKQLLMSLLLSMVAFVLLISCGKDQSTNPYGNNPSPLPVTQPHTVGMANMTFSPSSITVAKGTTVTWQNNDYVLHTATSDSGSWDTGHVPAGGSKAITFNTAGTFTYHCFFHGSMGMTGSVIVQ
jgi:plastocyanin